MEIEKRIEKYSNGEYTEIYHKKGDRYLYHNENGPAFTRYNKDGSIYSETYYINNNVHREDGSARIWYNKNGSIKYEEYWVNEIFLTKEEWEREFSWKVKLKGTPMGEIYCK